MSLSKLLAEILDTDPISHKHISNVSKTSFYRLLLEIYLIIHPKSDVSCLGLILRRLNYCSALFEGRTKGTLNKLQLIQKSAARVLTQTTRSERVAPVLSSLRRLPAKQRIEFKRLLTVLKCFYGLVLSHDVAH